MQGEIKCTFVMALRSFAHSIHRCNCNDGGRLCSLSIARLGFSVMSFRQQCHSRKVAPPSVREIMRKLKYVGHVCTWKRVCLCCVVQKHCRYSVFGGVKGLLLQAACWPIKRNYLVATLRTGGCTSCSCELYYDTVKYITSLVWYVKKIVINIFERMSDIIKSSLDV